MFEEIIREVKKLSQPRQVSISVPLDEKGYYDRECPTGECGGAFKVLFDDWRDKVSDERAFCPFCRHEAPADEWNTDEQARHIQSVAEAEMSRLLGNAVKRGVARSRPLEMGGGLFNVTASLSYKPGRIPPVWPAKATTELRQDFTCEECECRYASVGASFFCPACGHNSAASSFDNTLETVRKTISALQSVRTALAGAADVDVAHDAVRQVVEDQLSRLVGAFERLNEVLFEKLPNASQHPRKRGVFQRVGDASSLWKQASGKGFEDFLSAAELERLKLLYQRRHVLSHRQGIVDQSYLDRSGDTAYTVGQRLVIRERDVLELVELLDKLAGGLRTLV